MKKTKQMTREKKELFKQCISNQDFCFVFVYKLAANNSKKRVANNNNVSINR